MNQETEPTGSPNRPELVTPDSGYSSLVETREQEKIVGTMDNPLFAKSVDAFTETAAHNIDTASPKPPIEMSSVDQMVGSLPATREALNSLTGEMRGDNASSINRVLQEYTNLPYEQRADRTRALMGLGAAMKERAKSEVGKVVGELVALRAMTNSINDPEIDFEVGNEEQLLRLFNSYAEDERVPLAYRREFRQIRGELEQRLEGKPRETRAAKPEVAKLLEKQEGFSREDIAALNTEFHERLKNDPFRAAQLLAQMKRAGFGFNPNVSPRAAARMEEAKSKLVAEIETYRKKNPDMFAGYLTYLKYTGIYEPSKDDRTIIGAALRGRLGEPVEGQDNTQLAMQARYLKALDHYSDEELSILKEGASGGARNPEGVLSRAKAAARLKYIGGRATLSEQFHGAVNTALERFKEADNLPLASRLAYVYKGFLGGKTPELEKEWVNDNLAKLKEKRSWSEYLGVVGDAKTVGAESTEVHLVGIEDPMKATTQAERGADSVIPEQEEVIWVEEEAESSIAETAHSPEAQATGSLTELSATQVAERAHTIYHNQQQLEGSPAGQQAIEYVDGWSSAQKNERDPLWQILTKYTPEYVKWATSGSDGEPPQADESDGSRAKYLRIVNYDLDVAELGEENSRIAKMSSWVAKVFTRVGFGSWPPFGRKAQENISRARQEAVASLRLASSQTDVYSEPVRLAATEMANRLELANLREQIKRTRGAAEASPPAFSDETSEPTRLAA